MVQVDKVPMPPAVRALLAEEHECESRRSRRGFGRRSRTDATVRVEQIAAALDSDVCEEVRVDHDSTTVLLTHEHGLVVLTPHAEHTLMLDISSVGDDPRWDLYVDGRLMQRSWRWIRVATLGPFAFSVSGDSFTPDNRGDLHGTRLEEYLTEGPNGWPGDDAVVAMPLPALVELI
jgi:hypothetical protein